MPHFTRYIGIDYSGAQTADSSCKGIRVFMAEISGEPAQVQPPPSPRRYWTRRGLAEWLREELDRDIPTLVGIDHAFSFPLAYFEKYRLPSDWAGAFSKTSTITGRPMHRTPTCASSGKTLMVVGSGELESEAGCG